MVEIVGETEAVVARVAPTSGKTMTWDAPETCQERVTAAPEVTEVEEAVKLVIVGLGPEGMLVLV